jgi:SAM-dependent methyltransferase
MFEMALFETTCEDALACDLCGAHALERAYRAASSARDLTVYVCTDCGLAQSLPRIDHVPERVVAVSSGADWGNIRYGKGFRTEAAMAMLGAAIDLRAVRRVLDVGANRGSFIHALRAINPGAQILAVEPDGRVVASYAGLPGVETRVERIENVALEPGVYDLIYSSHTLEHVKSVRDHLAQMADALSADGVLFIEAPNIDLIGARDVVEEWFIDKHLYHFSPASFLRALGEAGLEVIRFSSDAENLTAIARRAVNPLDLIDGYARRLKDNRKRLKQAATRITAMAGKGRRVAVWGGGRIFRSIVEDGGLDPGVLAGVIDRELWKYCDRLFGQEIHQPAALEVLAPDVVLVASRAYFDEIAAEVSARLPNARIISFAQLLTED